MLFNEYHLHQRFPSGVLRNVLMLNIFFLRMSVNTCLDLYNFEFLKTHQNLITTEELGDTMCLPTTPRPWKKLMKDNQTQISH